MEDVTGLLQPFRRKTGRNYRFSHRPIPPAPLLSVRVNECQRHRRLTLGKVSALSLPDLDAAKLWMVNEHLGRRNFTDEQLSYWRFRQLELEKQPHGGQKPGKCQNGTSPKKGTKSAAPKSTADKVAKQHHVSESTVHRDVKFGRAVDIIASTVGEHAKDAILRGEVKIGRQEVQKLAESTAGPQACAAGLLQPMPPLRSEVQPSAPDAWEPYRGVRISPPPPDS